jgi:hypothetical protein
VVDQLNSEDPVPDFPAPAPSDQPSEAPADQAPSETNA